MDGEPQGALQKLLIETYADEQYDRKVGEFSALFNPDKYALKYEIEYNERQPAGTAANAPSFSNMKSQELALEFVIDGTGVASNEDVDVASTVDEFLDQCYAYDGEIHSNRYLRVSWASLIFDCILRSADVNYTLFTSSGKPLRAKIAAKFVGFVNDELRERQQDASSPDRHHIRQVGPRGRIDRMTHLIYDTPEYYIDVARTNDLTNFRKLAAGDELLFPPVVREGTSP